MSASRFVIAPTLLGSLSSLVPGEKAPLSPLRAAGPADLSPDQLAALQAAGLFENGVLTETNQAMLQALSAAAAFARVRLSAPGAFLDEAVYFGSGLAVHIGNVPEGLALSQPADAAQILDQLQGLTGSSGRAPAAWSVELPALEGLALATLLDLRRKAVLRGLLDNKPVFPPPSTALAIAEVLPGLLANPQWFSAGVQNTCGLTAAPSAPQLQAALDALAGKQLAWQQNGSYFPLPDAIQAADRFLLTGIILTLDLGHANTQGKVAISRQTWLQSGVSEMLQISQVGSLVRLETVSPAAALERLQFALTNPDALPAPELEVTELALTQRAGPGAGQLFALKAETVIGRGEQADVRIMDARASRRHAVIARLAQGYQISDAGSTNGTFVNEQLLTAPAWLKEGDIISIGETRLQAIRAGSTPPPLVASERTVYASGLPAAAPLPLAEPMPPAPPAPIQESPAAVVPPAFGAEAIPMPPAAFEPVQPPTEAEPPAEPALPVMPVVPSAPIIPPAPVIPPPPVQPTPIAPTCPNCHAPITPGTRFCGACGSRLE